MPRLQIFVSYDDEVLAAVKEYYGGNTRQNFKRVMTKKDAIRMLRNALEMSADCLISDIVAEQREDKNTPVAEVTVEGG